jgi:hypothetical protein
MGRKENVGAAVKVAIVGGAPSADRWAGIALPARRIGNRGQFAAFICQLIF